MKSRQRDRIAVGSRESGVGGKIGGRFCWAPPDSQRQNRFCVEVFGVLWVSFPVGDCAVRRREGFAFSFGVATFAGVDIMPSFCPPGVNGHRLGKPEPFAHAERQNGASFCFKSLCMGQVSGVRCQPGDSRPTVISDILRCGVGEVQEEFLARGPLAETQRRGEKKVEGGRISRSLFFFASFTTTAQRHDVGGVSAGVRCGVQWLATASRTRSSVASHSEAIGVDASSSASKSSSSSNSSNTC